ncbi:TetR/AcrR family transcriptional regulator [Actinospica sp.]|jgi:AcrR family transcriptional regulator|uniref:TetR/AcrR family transcriptional regulator n=1 Tax=Actinospica sp. TaxID=1872142 RepID=UPI002C11CB38|nr:TetR/AcrR family transcriptional regulator [Actinospica sp.]HWG27587.1 TetR/AcrR family transcriptional regulator [Actinospica sp.]
MTAIKTARERARAELTWEIKQEARRQLAATGASGLSLRAVARELGMVSSALYRYFPSRDELLTALIVDAYAALGEHVEAAERAVPPTHFRSRLRAVCRAVRDWAVQHPHEYALVYGSPVPGYDAPEHTVEQGGRVPFALLGLLRDAWIADALDPAAAPAPTSAVFPAVLAEQTAVIAAAVEPDLPGPLIARGAMMWTQLFGMVSFELFGQLRNSLDPADAFFDYAVGQLADFLRLAADPVF